MRNVTVDYLREDPRTGSFQYRRRVPKILAGVVKKREFLKVLGKTQSEAVMHYGREHERIEHLISLAKNGVTGLSPLEQSIRLTALLESWGADPHSQGLDDNELTWRGEAVDRLVGKYQDNRTGEYVGVPEEEGAIAGALLAGVSKETPEVTITDAFAAYLIEKVYRIPEQRKKQEQRLKRSEKNVIFVLGGDKSLAKVTRSHARAWRDLRLKQVSPTTVRRERNDIGAVFSWAISEMDGAGETNPFNGMKLPAAGESRQDQRLPLDQSVIDNVYEDLNPHRELFQIWTLLDRTGARDSEIRMLLVSEIIIDDPIPHIVIQPRPDRTLKSKWSERKIPLIGAALDVAKVVIKDREGSELAFPSSGAAGGLDRLSKALNRRIRDHTDNPKHVAYSLRHNMKDRMRLAEVFPEKARALEGHAYSAGQEASYGGGYPLEQLREALERALKGYREG
jgi:integrase